MPSELEHIECANRTQKSIALLLQDRSIHSPWIAIAAFYKALHVVEAVFANDRSILHSPNHGEREASLKTNRKYEKIYRHYGPLKRDSLNARYLSECRSFDDYLSPVRVVNELLRDHLHQIEETACKNFLAPPNALDRITMIVPQPVS